MPRVPLDDVSYISSSEWVEFLWRHVGVTEIFSSRINQYLASQNKTECSEEELVEALMAVLEISAHGCSVTQAHSEIGKKFFRINCPLSRKRLLSILQGLGGISNININSTGDYWELNGNYDTAIGELERKLTASFCSLFYVPGCTMLSVDDDHLRGRGRVCLHPLG